MGEQKNILLISVDDAIAFWRYTNAFGARLQLPNLERIFKAATPFTSAYCQVPICGPSRASAMSGLAPHETGIFDNYTNIFEVLRPEQMWQFRLKQQGYYCSTAGKVHHGYKPLPPEIHNVLYSHPPRRVHFGPVRDAPAQAFGGKTGGFGTTEPKDDRGYYDFRSSQDAFRFLRDYDSDAPFYREVGFHHPHLPFRTPIRFKEMYDIDEFIQPADWAGGFDLSEFTARYMIENMDTDDVDFWRKTIRNYFSAFSHVDHHIGRVWDTLQNSKHAKNTVTIIFSDHGYHMGDKGRFRKFTLWEEAARVPLIIHDPTAEARPIDDPAALVDLGPTILDYAGCQPMVPSVGRSLRPAINGDGPVERSIPTFWYGSASIRSGQYRTTQYQDGSTEFYDVDKDPWLRNNIAATSPDFAAEHAKLVKTSGEYGVALVTDGSDPDPVGHYHSLGKGGDHSGDLPTDGVISYGSLTPRHNAPGFRKQFVTPDENTTIEMAPGVTELQLASDTNAGVSHLVVKGNADDNIVKFLSGHNRFTVEIHTGPGNNRIYLSHDTMVVHAGPGSNHIQAVNGGCTVYCGTGNDVLNGGHARNELHGGFGDTTFIGGPGDNFIFTGHGDNTIKAGAGTNEITLEGGKNDVDLLSHTSKLIFERTELPQTIAGFSAGELDFSDWRRIGDLKVAQRGSDVTVTCGTEAAVFVSADIETIQAAIT